MEGLLTGSRRWPPSCKATATAAAGVTAAAACVQGALKMCMQAGGETEGGAGPTEGLEDAVEAGPTGGHGVSVEAEAAVGGEPAEVTQRGGARTTRRMTMSRADLGIGLAQGIWPMAISTKAADCTIERIEGQAFKNEYRSL
jgi:hypothetical protein